MQAGFESREINAASGGAASLVAAVPRDLVAPLGEGTVGENTHEPAAHVVDGKPRRARFGEVEAECGLRIEGIGRARMESEDERCVRVRDPREVPS